MTCLRHRSVSQAGSGACRSGRWICCCANTSIILTTSGHPTRHGCEETYNEALYVKLTSGLRFMTAMTGLGQGRVSSPRQHVGHGFGFTVRVGQVQSGRTSASACTPDEAAA